MTGLTVDDVLDKIGSLGRYQVKLICILSYMMWINIGFQFVLLIFVAAEPPWRCASNSTACPLKGEFKPGDDNYNFRCNLSRSDWEFSKSLTSVVTEFDLICDKTILASLSSSAFFVGLFISSLFIGVLSDKFGRKPVLFTFGFASAVFGVIGAFPNVYWLFVVCRILVGVSAGAISPMFVLATEYVGVKHRHAAGTSLWYSWTMALLSLSGIAYFVRDWRTLSIICAAPGLPIVFCWWFVPESSRYLLLKGKIKETENILRTIAQTNGKEYPSESLSDLTIESDQKTGDLRDLFRTKQMAHRTLISWYAWLVNGLVYYGVMYASPSLGGNMYLNFFFTSIIEFPGNYAAIWIMGRYGRKKPLVYGLVIASLASIGTILFTMYDPGDDDGFLAGRIVMAMAAKLFVLISFDAIYVYAAELFPTVIRNVGMAACTTGAMIGSFTVPYIVNLNRIHPLLPFGIMALKSFIAGVLCMTLPETKGLPTAEIMDTNRGDEGAGNNLLMKEVEQRE